MLSKIQSHGAGPSCAVQYCPVHASSPELGVPSFEDVESRVDLVPDGISWPVRDQGRRGTCNAFAVVAAEELYHLIRDPERVIEPLSEEFLDQRMRGIEAAKLAQLDLIESEIKDLEASGGTFLLQAIIAMKQHGLAGRKLMKYQESSFPNFHAAEPTAPAIDDAQARREEQDRYIQFEHNIICKRHGQDGGAERFCWYHTIKPELVSRIFVGRLQNSVPVIASFAFLEGNDAWWSSEAKEFGEIRYPRKEFALGRRKKGGHTVCITGFRRHPDDPSRGWFEFRNSHGMLGMARQNRWDTTTPHAPAEGWGYISTEDVDRYCWEYLYRKDDAAAQVA